ncbi:WAS/WASL-interacting protein family member 3-like isoform X2 [Triticum dicoccoides]|uniref:WAS/WASL-interacting protein family member 3-like isoform X2 n=1 Tax=Triticum dicoccoides TaxID=85692 RepID=UPI00188F2AB1|nr:WAS/WASL-interacting protein family member 3-like isoform X2 [Triticum dicoccoides]
MDARGPRLRASDPHPGGPRRRLGRPPCPLQELRADPAAWRPPPPICRRESPDPAPLRPASPSFVRSRYLPDTRSSGERHHKTLPPLPRSPPWRSSPLRLDSSTVGSMMVSSRDPPWRLPPLPSRSICPRIHGGAAEIRRPFCDASARQGQRRGRQGAQEDLHVGLAYRKCARELTSIPAQATAGTPVFFKMNSFPDSFNRDCGLISQKHMTFL